MMSSLHSTGTSTVSITRQRWLSSATRAFDGGQAAHSGSGWRAGGVAGRAGCWGRAAVRTDDTESFSVNFAAVSPPEPASSSSTVQDVQEPVSTEATDEKS